MKFPQFIQLGNTRYKIVTTENCIRSGAWIRKKKRVCCAGQINYCTRTIKISTNYPDQDQLHTLWHEITHYLTEDWGWAHPTNMDYNSKMEVYCSWFANRMIQILRENPWLAKLGDKMKVCKRK